MIVFASILTPGTSRMPWRPPASRPVRWPSAPRAPSSVATVEPPARRSPAWA